MKRHFRWEGLCIFLLAITLPLSAQSQLTGSIRGTITDTEGEPLPGVTVAFESEALIQSRVAVTGANGQYRAPLLPPGDYKLTITMTGFKTATQEMKLALAQTARLDVRLELGAVEETMTVTSTETGLEAVTVVTNFDYDDVDKLPMNNRQIDVVAQNAPGVAVTFNGDIQIAGANTYENNFLLNGADIGDNYFGAPTLVYIEEAVAETQVMTSGISARYGRFTGGVVNAITKTGGNEFEGSLRAQFTNDKWDATNPFNRGSEITDDVTKRYQATFGGPIIKDRLWFFLAAHNQPDAETTLTLAGYDFVSGGTLGSPSSQDRLEGKITWGITPNHTLTTSYLDYESATGPPRMGLPSGDLDFVNTGIRSDERNILSIQYKGILSNSVFLDVQYTEKEASIASGGDPNAGNPIYHANDFLFFNNHWWDFTDLDERNNETFSANVNYFLDTSAGAHSFNFGVQRATGITGGENRQSATGTNFLIFGPRPTQLGDTAGSGFEYTFGGTDAPSGTFVQRWVALPLGAAGAKAEIEQTSAYIDDEWTVNDHWTVNIGVRWDDYTGTGPSINNLVDFNDFSPRMGLSYDVNGDGSFKWNATLGKYVGRFHENISNNGTGIGGAPRLIDFYVGPTVVTTNPNDQSLPIYDEANWVTVGNTDPTVATFLRDDAKSPYSNEFTIGFQKTFGQAGSYGVTYVNREYKRLYDDFIGFDGQIDDDGTLLDVTTWGNTDLAKREYQSLIVTFQQRAKSWNFGGNLTWAELEGNHISQGTNQPGVGTDIGDYPLAFPEELIVQNGPLTGDIRLRSRIWGMYQFNFGKFGTLDVGGLFRYESGDVYSLDLDIPLPDGYDNPYVDDSIDFSYYYGGRGANRFPDYYTADLSLYYNVSAYKSLNWYLKASIQNVFNHQIQIGYNTTAFLRDGTGILAYEGQTVTGWDVAPRADLGDRKSVV